MPNLESCYGSAYYAEHLGRTEAEVTVHFLYIKTNVLVSVLDLEIFAWIPVSQVHEWLLANKLTLLRSATEPYSLSSMELEDLKAFFKGFKTIMPWLDSTAVDEFLGYLDWLEYQP